MRVTIEISVHNGTTYPERHSRAEVKVDATERHGRSNVITKGLIESSGQAALKLAEAMKK